MEKANVEIREMIEKSGLKYWHIAAKLGISASYFSVKLRAELTDQEKEKIKQIIKELGGK